MDTKHALILVLAFTALVYAFGVTGPLVYEDAHVRDVPVTFDLPGRGLTMLTHAWTSTPIAAHLFNLSLHLLNGCLVYLVGVTLGTPVIGLLAASLFLTLPLNSQAVQYVAARSDLLMTTWALLAVLWVLRLTTVGGAWRLFGMGLALIFAAMSQEIGLVSVGLVVLTLAIWRRRTPQAAFVLNVIIGTAGLVLGLVGWKIAAWFEMAAGSGGSFLSWPQFALVQLTALWRLLVFWPLGLSIDHDMLALSQTYGWIAVLGTILVGTLVLSRRSPWLLYSVGWVAICVGPRFFFATNEFLFEQDVYLATVGPCLGLSVACAHWMKESAHESLAVSPRTRREAR